MERKFLGYRMTWHQKPRLSVATPSLEKLTETVRELLRGRMGTALTTMIETLKPGPAGWATYFKLTETRGLSRN